MDMNKDMEMVKDLGMDIDMDTGKNMHHKHESNEKKGKKTKINLY
jgi:hypothetical protein